MIDRLIIFYEILKKFFSLIFLLFVWFLYLSIFVDTGNIENITCYINDDFFNELDNKVNKIIWIQSLKQAFSTSIFIFKIYFLIKNININF